jgi:hypothetical protein
MIITRSPLKRRGARIEIKRVVKRCVEGLFTKVIIERWIIKEATVLGDSRTYQLAWYLAMQIVHDNPSVHNIIGKLL